MWELLAVVVVAAVALFFLAMANGDSDPAADEGISLLVQSLGGQSLSISAVEDERFGYRNASAIYRVSYLDKSGNEHTLLCTTHGGRVVSHHEVGRVDNPRAT